MCVIIFSKQVCKCSPDSVRIDMDVFLTKLFDPSDGSKNQDTLSEDAWVFSCACNKYYSSEDQKYTVEVRTHIRMTEAFSQVADALLRAVDNNKKPCRTNGLSVLCARFGLTSDAFIPIWCISRFVCCCFC